MTGSLLPGRSTPDQGSDASAVASYAPLGGAVAEFGGGGQSEPGSHPITRVIAALRRFAWLIVLCTVLGTAGSIIVTRFLRPEYVARGTIFIQTEGGAPNAGPIQAPELLSSYNWVELIETYAVLDPVVRELNLYVRPGKGAAPELFAEFQLRERFTAGNYVLTVEDDGARYSLKNRAGNQLSSGPVTDSVGREAGFLWAPGPQRLTPGLEAQFTVLAPRDAAASLSERLDASLSDERSNFLHLSLSGTDPKLISEIINAVQRSFMTVAADIKKQQLRELVSLLGNQMRQQEGKLRGAERSLESFKVATITQPKENVAIASGLQMTMNPSYGRYFDQRVEIETIRNERRDIEEVLARSADGGNTIDAFNTIPAVKAAPDLSRVLMELSQAEADLRALRTKYTDEYSDVRKLQDRIASIRRVTVPTYAQALIRQLRIREADLDTRLNAASEELKGIPTRTIEEGRLQREMESARILFLTLQNRYEEANLAEISAIPDVQIMDAAKPATSPSKNQASLIILLGLAGGLGIGLGLAVLLDRLDKRFRYPEQASHELGLVILGAVPGIPKPRGGRAAPSEEMAQVVEAFRSIRLNLAHSFEPGAPICITVSSPSPGDGKSLIASNLGLSFAEAGYRTLLLDGDTRRGNLHRTFGCERRPGLLDFLSAPALSLDRTFRTTSHKNLTLIPCGVRLQHGPELLGSARMAEMVARLKSQFEVVLVDSPPLGAGIDPFVLGTHSGNILIVLRSGETDKEMAEVKLRILDRLPVRTLGAVLNHIDAGAGAYKYYSYSYGYAAEDEGENAEVDNRLPKGEAPVST
jgi:capsular exopolysaccharide synthesis family protein